MTAPRTQQRRRAFNGSPDSGNCEATSITDVGFCVEGILQMKTRLLFLIFVASLTHFSICVGNESMGTPVAKVEIAKADAARDRGDFAAARDAYHRTTEIDPDFAKAHESYIFTYRYTVDVGNLTSERLFVKLALAKGECPPYP